MFNFNEKHFDALKEIGNIGAGNAATSLSILLNKKIDITVPTATLTSFDEVFEQLGGEEEILFSIFLRMSGDIEGNLFLFLKEETANFLLKNIVDYHDCPKEDCPIKEFELSILKEIGNILSGTYISALSDLANLRTFLSEPIIQKDMVGATLSFGLLEYGEIGNEAILLKTSFSENENYIQGYFAFLPSPKSFEVIFKKLGIDF